jgi:hypothetical protein
MRKGAQTSAQKGVTMIKEAMKGFMQVFDASLPLQTRIKEHYSMRGMPWHEANIIGVRLAKDFYTNKFQDVLALVTDKTVIALNATTVPGPHWTPENQKKFGVYPAIICLGYYQNAYGFTNHKGHPKNMALGQRVKLPCFRDHSRDSVMQDIEGPYFEPASAGMNIHTQMDFSNDDKIDFASAGCQVARNRELFLDAFMTALHNTAEGKKGAAARFSYFLTDGGFPMAAELKKLAR